MQNLEKELSSKQHIISEITNVVFLSTVWLKKRVLGCNGCPIRETGVKALVKSKQLCFIWVVNNVMTYLKKKNTQKPNVMQKYVKLVVENIQKQI